MQKNFQWHTRELMLLHFYLKSQKGNMRVDWIFLILITHLLKRWHAKNSQPQRKKNKNQLRAWVGPFGARSHATPCASI